MPIIRLKKPNGDQDKKMPDTETINPRRRPQRAHLFARIAHLKHRSSTKALERSRQLIENSHRLIFETEISLTKDDLCPSCRSPQWYDCKGSSVAPSLDYRTLDHRIGDSRDTLILHEKYVESSD